VRRLGGEAAAVLLALVVVQLLALALAALAGHPVGL